MLTFLHLSDIHFRSRDHATQFDLDQGVRRALLEDVERRPAGAADYDAVLITGDVAFGGKLNEYVLAREFLEELFVRSGALATNTFVVPGNHDVDRAFVEPDLPLWAAHEKLRESNDATVWRDHIYKQLVKDPQRSLLAPLGGYNNFAQGFGCFTGMVPSAKAGEPDIPRLSWQRILEKPLDDGSHVRIYGLNSALISDAGDAPGKLLVSSFQTAELQHTEKIVNLVMCHHPPDWLMDKSAIRNSLASFVPLALFGHEHETRVTIERSQAQLFAGAAQPSRRDPNWIPTYHILQLSVIEVNGARQLYVKIFTREYTETPPARFRSRRAPDEREFEECYIALPALKATTAMRKSSVLLENQVASGVAPAMTASEPNAPSPMETAQHELLVHFFQLRTPLRYDAAFKTGLLRDGDDALDPQVMWAEVFRRASEENKLGIFWDAIAAHSPTIKGKSNPFT